METIEYTVKVNGKKVRYCQKMSLQELLKDLQFKGENFAVAIDCQFVPRSKYDDTEIASDCQIEVLTPMQGG